MGNGNADDGPIEGDAVAVGDDDAQVIDLVVAAELLPQGIG